MTVDGLGIPDYVDVTVIAQGGFATVYRARHQVFERLVAIKVLESAEDEQVVRRFQQECAAIGSLSGHPHIVTVYETGQLQDQRRFIVMEFLPRGSLADHLSRFGPMAADDVLDLGVKLAGALASAHGSQIVHGDIKPDNILLSGVGEPKLADFGIASIRGASAEAAGETSATVTHAPPELLRGEEPSVQGDIYALCSTLFTLLSGRPPFPGDEHSSLVAHVARITYEPPPDLGDSDVPSPIREVLTQGLSKAPGERQADASQLGRQLQAVQVALGLPITRLPIEVADSAVDPRPGPAPQGKRPAKAQRSRRRPSRTFVAALVAAAAIGALAVPRVVRRPAPLPLLYQDNFDGGQSWYEHESAEGLLRYDGGQYRMAVDPPNQVLLSDTSFRGGSYGEPLTALTDVSVRVTVTAASPASVVGVFCRDKPAGYYQAVIRTDGSALLLKTSPNALVSLGNATSAGLGTAGPTTIRLDCLGQSPARLDLFVNDEKVISAIDRTPFRSGSVGMIVASEAVRADARFDDFALYGRRAGS